MQAKEPSLAIRQAIIYQINLRVFTREGTIRAARQYLPDVAATGANIVYLCPFVLADDDPNYAYWSDRQKLSSCSNPRNPYRLADYFQIDPEYGDDKDLLDFVQAAHGLSLKVMFDLVYMHAGPTFGRRHPLFVKHDEHGEPVLNAYFFCTIDFESQELREYLWSNMLYFVEKFGVDGYRCDCGGSVPLDFWEEGVRRVRKLRPDFMMLDEHELKNRPEDQRDAFDINYSQFWLQIAMRNIFVFGAPVSELETVWCNEHRNVANGMSLRGIEHHDNANDLYNQRMEKGRHAKCEAAYVINFCIDGVPFLYNGCEYQDYARHSIFGLPGQFTIDRSKDPAPRFALFQQLAALHRTESAILYGTTRWLHHNCLDQVAAFARDHADQHLFCAANLGDSDQSVCCPAFLPFARGSVLMSRGYQGTANGFTLAADGYVVIRTTDNIQNSKGK